MNIRRLTLADGPAYRRLRLRGLRAAPAAFGSSHREEAKRPLAAFLARLEPSETKFVWGAFVTDRLVGVVTLIREEKIKEQHKASIYGLYVDVRHRRQGLGRNLLTTALGVAQRLKGLRQLRLGVVASNQAALQLYVSLGFKVYGKEPAALRVNGRYHDEFLMVRRIRRQRSRTP